MRFILPLYNERKNMGPLGVGSWRVFLNDKEIADGITLPFMDPIPFDVSLGSVMGRSLLSTSVTVRVECRRMHPIAGYTWDVSDNYVVGLNVNPASHLAKFLRSPRMPNFVQAGKDFLVKLQVGLGPLAFALKAQQKLQEILPNIPELPETIEIKNKVGEVLSKFDMLPGEVKDIDIPFKMSNTLFEDELSLVYTGLDGVKKTAETVAISVAPGFLYAKLGEIVLPDTALMPGEKATINIPFTVEDWEGMMEIPGITDPIYQGGFFVQPGSYIAKWEIVMPASGNYSKLVELRVKGRNDVWKTADGALIAIGNEKPVFSPVPQIPIFVLAGVRFPKSLPAGEPLTIVVDLMLMSHPNVGDYIDVADLYFFNDTDKTEKRFPLNLTSYGAITTIPIELPMPFAEGPAKLRIMCSVYTMQLSTGNIIGANQWEMALPTLPLYPDIKFLKKLPPPASVFAGLPFPFAVGVKNEGSRGKVRIAGEERTVGEGEWEDVIIDYLTMPAVVKGQEVEVKFDVLGPGKVWKTTESTIFKVFSALPRPEFLKVNLPDAVDISTEFTPKIEFAVKQGPLSPDTPIRLLLNNSEIAKGSSKAATLEFTPKLIMPIKSLLAKLELQSFGSELGGQDQWRTTDTFIALVNALQPKAIVSGTPTSAPAGEVVYVDVTTTNAGAEGTVRGKFEDVAGRGAKLKQGESIVEQYNFIMPYNNTEITLQGESLIGDKWQIDSDQLAEITALFPKGRLLVTEAPEFARPGTQVSIPATIVNIGSRGDIGVEFRNLGKLEVQKSALSRLDSGAETKRWYTFEMPPIEQCAVSVSALSKKEDAVVSADLPKSELLIQAEDCLYHYSNLVRIKGGESFKGVIVGANVAVNGEKQPPAPVTPIVLDLSGHKTADITFDSIDYLKLMSDREFAVVKGSTLVSRRVKSYEYSTLPLPSMVMNLVSAQLTALTRAPSEVREGKP